MPAGANLHSIVDAIHKEVLETTRENAREAEQEWHGAARSRNMQALSAEPAINVKPTLGGTEISVRYITRARERSQLRAKINQALVELLGSGPASQVQSDAATPAPLAR